jgi:hypothetical protein
MKMNRVEAVQIIAKLVGCKTKYCEQIYYKDWKTSCVNLPLEPYAFPMVRKHKLIYGIMYLENSKYTCQNAWNIFAVLH